MITVEVEPLGGFIGDAFVQPIYQGGLLLVPLYFILNQDPILGIAALAFYPVQIYVIPRIQRRVNQLAKRRVQTVRSLSDRIGESIAGIQDIHSNDASVRERADFAHRLGTIYRIRYDIYRLKFLAKFLNNSIDKLTPFLFYSLGGYLVFQGRVDIGALVAVIAAQKDLAAPWKELLDYYQQKEDVRIKYEQVVSQFEPADLLDESLLDVEPDRLEPIKGEYVGANITLAEGGSVKFLDGASFALPLKERIAIVGDGTSGKDELPLVLARLLQPTSGSITLNGSKLSTLPESIVGRRIGYVGPSAHLLASSVRDNLYYGLKHRPLRMPPLDELERLQRTRAADESALAGNITHDIAADWTDYGAAGAAGPAELTAVAIEVLRLVDMDEDIYQLGLRGRIDPSRQPELADAFLRARVTLRQRFADSSLAALVEPFDETKYNSNASLAENLLFGTPVGSTFSEDNLATDPYVHRVLAKAALTDDLLAIGRKVAETMVELFSGLPPGHEFFAQYSFISSDDLPEFQTLVARIGKDGLAELSATERARLLALPFRLVPARHRLGLIDAGLQGRILQARQIFAADLPPDLRSAIKFFDKDTYNAASTLQDNILFGKLAYGHPEGNERIGELIREVMNSLELRERVIEVGLEFQVGIGGSRLSGAQRQKLGLARALLKRPDVMILNQATASLDGQSQGRITSGLLDRFAEGGLIWSLHRASLARAFDRVLVMRSGRVVEHGRYDDLDQPGKALHELLKTE
jgi:ABC-type multidrug transport system fused ATPase/permease subunit